jgi:hypothetical protein
LFSFHPLQKKKPVKVTENLALRNSQRLRKFKPLLAGEFHCDWAQEVVARRAERKSPIRSTAVEFQ